MEESDVAARKAKSGKQTISSPGKKPVTFQKGGLHTSVGVPQGQKIPAAKMAAAKAHFVVSCFKIGCL